MYEERLCTGEMIIPIRTVRFSSERVRVFDIVFLRSSDVLIYITNYGSFQRSLLLSEETATQSPIHYFKVRERKACTVV